MLPRGLIPAILVVSLGAGLASPAVASPATHLLEAEAQSVRAEGVTLLSARLLALIQESGKEGGSPADFRLTADSVVVETTTREPTVHAAGVSVGIDPKTDSVEHRAATFVGLRVRPNDRFDVFALPQHAAPALNAQTGCSSWQAPSQSEVVRDPRIPTRAERTAKAWVDEGAEVTQCGGDAVWTVRGDFLILLWERDVEIRQTDGTRETIRSGRLPPQATSGSGLQNDNPISEDREIYLYVAGGVLEVPMDPRTVAYVGSGSSVAGANRLAMETASLHQAGKASHAGSVELHGDLSFELQPGTTRLRLDVAGRLAGASADGRSLEPGAAEVTASSSWALPWALGWAGMAVLAGVLVAYWRTSREE